jgi:hypothetical protein
MADGLTIAGALLVASALGAIPVAYPPLLGVWSAAREDHVRVIAAHRRSWAFLNAGFLFATVVTAAGLAALAATLGGDPARTAALWGVAVAYAIAGVPWCAVVAIRSRTTPALFDLGAIDAPPAAPEVLLHAATGGLFAAFVLATAATLAVLGAVLLVAGGVAAPVAGVCAVVGVLAIAIQLATGDFIPAVLYVPTLAIGLALLAGWT